MNDTPINTENAAPQPDPAAMAALMAKIAKVQKILGFLTWGQILVGLAFLLALFWCQAEMGKFALMAVAPFYLALGYVADLAKKDLSQIKPVLRATAISQLGFALVLLIGLLYLPLPVQYWTWVVIALIFGLLPTMIIIQAKKG
ncbi:MAG TPA: hypothetical protein PKN87_05100 [Syntrophomonadaceae bacterium]|nr:hypothetical protein [Syntrophomonadaceae bacterium]HPR92870.1 hypothetical protein [Syntrophomonadaceae bacterium]